MRTHCLTANKKMIITVALAILVFAAMILVFCIVNRFLPRYDRQEASMYEQNLIFQLQKNDSVTVGEIFTFDFNRAYVVKDNYLDGENFAKKYGLDIQIDEVPENTQEDIRRIIFVDAEGNFVYEFRYVLGNRLCPKEEGIILTPNTEIRKCASRSSLPDAFGIAFMVSEEDYY